MKSIDDIAAALQGYDPQALSVDQVNAFCANWCSPCRLTNRKTCICLTH